MSAHCCADERCHPIAIAGPVHTPFDLAQLTKAMNQLVSEFVATGERISKIICAEMALPPERKTIPSLDK
jgi:hypothetical protein